MTQFDSILTVRPFYSRTTPLPRPIFLDQPMRSFKISRKYREVYDTFGIEVFSVYLRKTAHVAVVVSATSVNSCADLSGFVIVFYTQDDSDVILSTIVYAAIIRNKTTSVTTHFKSASSSSKADTLNS